MTTRIRYFAIGILVAAVLVAIPLILENVAIARQIAIVVTFGILGAVCLILLSLHRRPTGEPGRSGRTAAESSSTATARTIW